MKKSQTTPKDKDIVEASVEDIVEDNIEDADDEIVETELVKTATCVFLQVV
jgi:hypothetical protein